jgi:glycosyltransferase involved in cell wall biosynthesis
VRRSFGIPDSAPVVGTLGRLTEIKRQDLLLRAFAQARRHHPGAHLLVVGEGPLRSELTSLGSSLGLEGAVHFAGYQSEPAKYLAALDIFALTSRSEGMPLVVLEAWAAGVPVVASAVGGLPELVREGENGLLFPSGDESALTAALVALLDDPERRRRLGRAGRQTVAERFDVRHMAAEYDRHYRDLLPWTRPYVCAS